MTLKPTLVIALLIILAGVSFGQTPIVKATTSCRLTRSSFPIIGGLRLGDPVAKLRALYPDLQEIAGAPPGNLARGFIVREPRNDVQGLLAGYSATDALGTYAIRFAAQKWSSPEEALKQVIDGIGVEIPKSAWGFYRDDDDGSDVVMIYCDGFIVRASLSDSADPTDKGFSFIVMDSALSRGQTGGRIPSLGRSINIPVIRSTNNQPYAFPANNSEFKVTFPSTPSVRTISSDYGTVEEATVATRDSTLRAEYGIMSEEQRVAAKTGSDEVLQQGGLQAARTFGYSNATVSVTNTPLGRKIVIRGYKTIQGVPVLIEHHGYYGDRTIITLIVAAKSSEFPTESVSKFLRSVKRESR